MVTNVSLRSIPHFYILNHPRRIHHRNNVASHDSSCKNLINILANMMLPCMPNFVKYKNFAGQLESKDEKFVVCVATKSCSTRKKKTNKKLLYKQMKTWAVTKQLTNCRVHSHRKPLEETLSVWMTTGRLFMIINETINPPKKIFNRNFTFHNESKFAFISLERDEICGGPQTDVRGPEAEALCFPPHAKWFL